MPEEHHNEEIIEASLQRAGWEWQKEIPVAKGLGRTSSDSSHPLGSVQRIDYLLSYTGLPLAVLEVKSAHVAPADVMGQVSRSAQHLGLRFAIVSNGRDWLLVDNETDEYTMSETVPAPHYLLSQQSDSFIDWNRWKSVFKTPLYTDEKIPNPRVHQQIAVGEVLRNMALGASRLQFVMATGTGKTNVTFQIVWKLLQGNAFENGRVLYLTDRSVMREQAHAAFKGFPANERIVIGKDPIDSAANPQARIFFATYQSLYNGISDEKRYLQFDAGFFDLVIVDECSRSAFGAWHQILEYFSSACHLGMSSMPFDSTSSKLQLTEAERKVADYFGSPVFSYTAKSATQDGFLVPYKVIQRSMPEIHGKYYDDREESERLIRLPGRTQLIANDLWELLEQQERPIEKTIVFCVDTSHAELMTQELQKLAGDPGVVEHFRARAGEIRYSDHPFFKVGDANPRIAVSVNMLTAGVDIPDLKNVVIASPNRSSSYYLQIAGLGARPCETIGKESYTIIDYVGIGDVLDRSFAGNPIQTEATYGLRLGTRSKQAGSFRPHANRGFIVQDTGSDMVYTPDGSKTGLQEYLRHAKETVRTLIPNTVAGLLELWMDHDKRKLVLDGLKEQKVDLDVLRSHFAIDGVDDVDVLIKLVLEPSHEMTRRQRALNASFFLEEGEIRLSHEPKVRDEAMHFWKACLDHYRLYGIDALEKGSTYSSPVFVEQFGCFSGLCSRYGGARHLRNDLEAIKQHLYVDIRWNEGDL